MSASAVTIDGVNGLRYRVPPGPGPSYSIATSLVGDTLSWSLDGPGATGTVASQGNTAATSLTAGPFPINAGDGIYTLTAVESLADPNGILPPATLDTATRTFVVDTTGPGAPTILTGPSKVAPTKSPSSFTWSTPPGTSIFEYVLDRPPVGAPTFVSTGAPAATFTSLPDGTHTLEVRGLDDLGNPGELSAGWTFLIDNTAPGAPTGLATPLNPTNNTRPTFTWAGAELGGTFQATIDARAPAAAVSPFQSPAPPLAGGPQPTGVVHTIAVRQTDSAGNVGPFSTPLSFTVDTVRPTIAATAGGDATFPAPGDNVTTAFGPTANVKILFNEPIRTTGGVIRLCVFPCGVGLDGTPSFGATSASFDPAAPLLAGTRYEIQLVGVMDSAGNSLTGIGTAPRSWTFTTSTDATPPGPVTALKAVGGIGQVGLTWARPLDPDLGRITVLRGTLPPTSAGDATVLRFSLAPTATSFTDIGLTAGITYHYAVYAEDAVGNPSALARAIAVPAGPRVLSQKPNPPRTINARFMVPRRGKLIGTLRPVLRWQAKKGAILYNIQVVNLNTGRKVVSTFPRKNRFRVGKGRLKAGHRFAWRVWAYRGRVAGYVKVPQTSWFDVSANARK